MHQFMHHLIPCFMNHVDFKDCIYGLFISLSNAVFPQFCVSVLFSPLFRSQKWPKRVVGSTSTSNEGFDQIRFCTLQNAQNFGTLVKYRSIWGERQIDLDMLGSSIKHNLESRNWLPLCSDLMPPLAALIKEVYSNLYPFYFIWWSLLDYLDLRWRILYY